MNSKVIMAISGLLVLVHTQIFADEYNGYVNWFNRTELSLPQSGVIATVNIKSGESILKGSELISLDTKVFRANLQFRTIQLKQAKLALEEAEKELERSQELYDRTLISEHDLALAHVAYINAQSQHLETEASFQLANQQLQQSKVFAPFDARVLKVNVLPHQYLNTQTENKVAVVIADNKQQVVEISVSPSHLRKFKLDQEVTVRMANTKIKGRVYAMDLEVGDKNSDTKLTVVIPYNKDYYTGMVATIITP